MKKVNLLYLLVSFQQQIADNKEGLIALIGHNYWIAQFLFNPIYPGGAHCAPPVTYLRITVQIHIRAR